MQKKTLDIGASPLRGPMENPMSQLIGNFKTIILEGSRQGASFFAELC
jgi:hypothetical protein